MIYIRGTKSEFSQTIYSQTVFFLVAASGIESHTARIELNDSFLAKSKQSITTTQDYVNSGSLVASYLID